MDLSYCYQTMTSQPWLISQNVLYISFTNMTPRYLLCSSIMRQLFKVCMLVSLHVWNNAHLLPNLLPHLYKVFAVGNMSSIAFNMNVSAPHGSVFLFVRSTVLSLLCCQVQQCYVTSRGCPTLEVYCVGPCTGRLWGGSLLSVWPS